MDIFKSFEVFLSEPLSVLKNRLVQIVGIDTEDGAKPQVTADLLNQKAQITVMNSQKMYNLLKRVNAKAQANIVEPPVQEIGMLKKNFASIPSSFKKDTNKQKLLPIFKKEKTKTSKAVFGQLTLRI